MPTSGDVVELNLGQAEGREAGLLHPAVIVTSQRILDAGPTVLHVVPLTSRIRRFHAEIVIKPDSNNGFDVASAAQCQHIRAVSPQRIATIRGNIGPLHLARIRETIAVIIDVL